MLNNLYQEELYILPYLNQILITAHFYGLIILDLSFYKKLLELSTFSHVTLTPCPLFKKCFILKFSDKFNLENILLLCKFINNLFLLFSMTGFYLHLAKTIMKLLGLALAVSLLTKLAFMARILLL